MPVMISRTNIHLFSIPAAIVLLCLFTAAAVAGISGAASRVPGDPPGKSPASAVIVLPAPDIEKLAADDLADGKEAAPYRFAVMIPAGISLEGGKWSSMHTGRVSARSLLITAPGALGLALYFDEFRLAPGERVSLCTAGGQPVRTYTGDDNPPSGLFAMPLLPGESVFLEYSGPSGGEGLSVLHLSEVAYAYRGLGFLHGMKGQSDTCEVNIYCSPEGDNWQERKDGVVRIQVKISGGAYWCTGSLVNNTRQDKTPYILTADHCAYKMGHYATQNDLDQWIFYFRYESQGCEPPFIPPAIKSITGATKVAQGGNQGNDGSDFYLLLLKQDIPPDFNPYYLGWSRKDSATAQSTCIHHPAGDIKKISTNNQLLQTISWNNSGLNSHWKVYWMQTPNGHGVTEGGSSGSPLFDMAGRIIGTLTGGFTSCTAPDTFDFYGKFSYHWQTNGLADTARLSPWLDPDNTGVTTLAGLPVGMEAKSPVRTSLRVYPNPATHAVTIEFLAAGAGTYRLSLADCQGRIISVSEHRRDEKTVLHLDGLAPGVYILRVLSGNDLTCEKLLVR
jgi:hypothetical protein